MSTPRTPSSSRRSRRPASSSSRPGPGRERRRCWSSATCAPSASAGSTSSRSSSSRTRSAQPASSRSRIRARLLELGRHDLARSLDGAWISTIHGFCHRLLKAHPFAAGIDPRYRVLDESQARVVQGEAFQQALTAFCAGQDGERLRLLATYGARGLRRMVTGAFETLRSAGRPLELELPGRSELPERLEELRDAAQCLLDEGPDETAVRALELLAAAPAAGRVARPLRLLGQGPCARALRDLRGGPRAGRAGGARRARAARPRPPPAAAAVLRRGLPRGQGPRLGARLRGPPAVRARPAARQRGDPGARALAAALDHGRRVPGHEPAPVRADRPARGRPHGFPRGLRRRRSRASPGSSRRRCGGAWRSSFSSATSSSRSTASATPTSRSSASGASRPAASSR